MTNDSHYFSEPPRLKAPPKTCDCHSHIYGPVEAYPVAAGEGRRLHADASIAEYRAVLAHLGVERSVIVTPSAYGTDNRVRSTPSANSSSTGRAVSPCAAPMCPTASLPI